MCLRVSSYSPPLLLILEKTSVIYDLLLKRLIFFSLFNFYFPNLSYAPLSLTTHSFQCHFSYSLPLFLSNSEIQRRNSNKKLWLVIQKLVLLPQLLFWSFFFSLVSLWLRKCWLEAKLMHGGFQPLNQIHSTNGQRSLVSKLVTILVWQLCFPNFNLF